MIDRIRAARSTGDLLILLVAGCLALVILLIAATLCVVAIIDNGDTDMDDGVAIMRDLLVGLVSLVAGYLAGRHEGDEYVTTHRDVP